MLRNNFSLRVFPFILALPYNTNAIAAATVLIMASMASVSRNKI